MAAQHRAKLIDVLAQASATGIMYLRGDTHAERHNTDVELPFRQESNFFYLTHVNEPGYHLIIDLASKDTTLFAPVISGDDAVWIGAAPSLHDQMNKFKIAVQHASAIQQHLSKLNPSTIHVLNFEKDLSTLGPFASKADKTLLSKALTTARLHKTSFEIDCMLRANAISAKAHVAVMKATSAKTTETELEALFRYECHRQGAPDQAYGPIVGAGSNAAILHYGRNNDSLADHSSHALLLVDAGCEYECYASDITRTFPITGKFTPQARAIYQTVLDAQNAVIHALRPGVQWEDMHRLAERVIAQGLIQCGILRGPLDECLAVHAQAVFFPHGLGHLIGLDVHDVGGYPEGVPRIQEPSIRYLRMRRTLEPGMVVTVEPGLYFVPLLIEQAKNSPASKYIDFTKVAEYSPVGGVRIEDDVLITETGYQNLTNVPKTIDEIESIMAPRA